MKSKCLFVLCALMLFGSIKAATINFDEWTVGHDEPMKELTDEYQNLGLIFEPGTTYVHLEGESEQAPSPHNLIKAWGIGSIILDVSFYLPDQPSVPGHVPWVEFTQDWGAQSGGGYVDAYDINGIKVISGAHFAQSGQVFRYEWEQGIHRLVIRDSYDDIDDFSFGLITPEPTTILFLSLGGLLLRKRKHR